MGHPDRSLSEVDAAAAVPAAIGAPLRGVRVLELASYVTGPYASALLADMGADVIKVEERTQGDPFRGWGKGGYSSTFRSVNRGKRSLAIDLRTDAGREAAQAIADRADVLIENYRPGVVDRLGLAYASVRARNPRIVYCSISGFGSSGPYRDRPGYDTVGQAMGLLGLLTDFEAPKAMGISLSDHITGIFACTGILAALVGRGATGRGRRVETSLLQATTAFVAENAARYFDDGEVPSRATRARIAQAYAFVGGDGGAFVIHLSSPPKFWQGLTEAVGRTDLRDDPRFVDRAARVHHYDGSKRSSTGSLPQSRAGPGWTDSRRATSQPVRSTGWTRSSTTPVSRRWISSRQSSIRRPGPCASSAAGSRSRVMTKGRSGRRRASASTAKRSSARSATRMRRSQGSGPVR